MERNWSLFWPSGNCVQLWIDEKRKWKINRPLYTIPLTPTDPPGGIGISLPWLSILAAEQTHLRSFKKHPVQFHHRPIEWESMGIRHGHWERARGSLRPSYSRGAGPWPPGFVLILRISPVNIGTNSRDKKWNALEIDLFLFNPHFLFRLHPGLSLTWRSPTPTISRSYNPTPSEVKEKSLPVYSGHQRESKMNYSSPPPHHALKMEPPVPTWSPKMWESLFLQNIPDL